MIDVQWVKGENNPPESGEYYIAIEAQHDISDYKKGDVEITTGYYDVDRGEYDTIGKDNPTWKVLCWADVLKPNIPKNLIGRVTRYFGEKVMDDDKQRGL